MQFKIELASPDNILESDFGFAINPTSDTFVWMDGFVSLSELGAAFSDLDQAIRRCMYKGFSHSISDFPKWNPEKVEERKIERSGDSLMAFKPVNGTNKLEYFKQPAVMDACLALGVFPKTTPHGKPRKNAPKGDGGLPQQIAALPKNLQERILDYAVFLTEDLDDVMTFGQRVSLGWHSVEEILVSSKNGWEALQRLLPLVEDSIVNQSTALIKGTGPRILGPSLFFAYLAAQGMLLWPLVDRAMPYLVPRTIKPLWWEVLAPGVNAKLFRALYDDDGTDPYTGTVRRLLLTTNFFDKAITPERLRLFVELKEHILLTEEASAKRKGHELNVIARDTLTHLGASFQDIKEFARFLGGGARLGSAHSAQPFDWVDHPGKGKAKYTKIFGGELPEEFSEPIKFWAVQLREILPAFSTKGLGGKIESFDFWIFYLMSLPPTDIPLKFDDIQRSRHIFSSDESVNTFSRFVSDSGETKARRIISDLAQAWEIAAATNGFIDTKSNPIDRRHDTKELTSQGQRPFHTRRSALTEDQVRCIRDVNTRDGYSFARRMGGYQKRTPSGEKVFWPAMPIMTEIMLGVGARSDSVLWACSGEGDLYWPTEQGWVPNPLRTAKLSRDTGLLMCHELGSTGLFAYGFKLVQNKTGLHVSPWIDDALVSQITAMRDWQIKYNPLERPIPAVRDVNGPGSNPSYDYPEVFPLFRDPEDRMARPPTRDTLYKYWVKLLREAEAEFNIGRSEEEFAPFFVDGKPKWDLHSIRVTLITNAVDAGIPIDAIQYITGHKSAAMAKYYDIHGPLRARQAFEHAKESERGRIAAALRNEESLKATGQTVEELLGFVGKAGDGMDMLKWSIKGQREITVFAHGICPGARCEEGIIGPKQRAPVFRPGACSRCDYRVTGARFTIGLAFRTNVLAAEQFLIQERIRDLNREKRALEDAGKATKSITDIITRTSDELDEVNKEWCVEYAVCKSAEQKAMGWVEGTEVTELGEAAESIELKQVHPLRLLQGVLDVAEIIPGGSFYIPEGVEAKRNEMLRELAYRQNMAGMLIRIDPRVEKAVMHKFGQLLVAHVDAASPEGDRYLEDLILGIAKFRPADRFIEALEAILKRIKGDEAIEDA
ncbi:MAG: VPA1269 family protein [Devosia sp.]